MLQRKLSCDLAKALILFDHRKIAKAIPQISRSPRRGGWPRTKIFHRKRCKIRDETLYFGKYVVNGFISRRHAALHVGITLLFGERDVLIDPSSISRR